MNLDEILAIIERIGSDNPPTVSELETAQTELSRALHAEAKVDSPDLAVLTTLRKALSDTATALTSAQADKAAQDAKIADLLSDVADPDASDAPDEEDEGEEEAEEEAPEEVEAREVVIADEVLMPVAAAASPPARTLPSP